MIVNAFSWMNAVIKSSPPSVRRHRATRLIRKPCLQVGYQMASTIFPTPRQTPA